MNRHRARATMALWTYLGGVVVGLAMGLLLGISIWRLWVHLLRIWFK